jgi:hypothetical protein
VWPSHHGVSATGRPGARVLPVARVVVAVACCRNRHGFDYAPPQQAGSVRPGPRVVERGTRTRDLQVDRVPPTTSRVSRGSASRALQAGGHRFDPGTLHSLRASAGRWRRRHDDSLRIAAMLRLPRGAAPAQVGRGGNVPLGDRSRVRRSGGLERPVVAGSGRTSGFAAARMAWYRCDEPPVQNGHAWFCGNGAMSRRFA